ncbi:hypothetical protein B0H14DRAFT_2570045 [Mycena olivaceomarginata]|nr:hypothetical protein B0H14DRAFT_2570045 [Mycena olivaceomarginata]
MRVLRTIGSVEAVPRKVPPSPPDQVTASPFSSPSPIFPSSGGRSDIDGARRSDHLSRTAQSSCASFLSLITTILLLARGFFSSQPSASPNPSSFSPLRLRAAECTPGKSVSVIKKIARSPVPAPPRVNFEHHTSLKEGRSSVAVRRREGEGGTMRRVSRDSRQTAEAFLAVGVAGLNRTRRAESAGHQECEECAAGQVASARRRGSAAARQPVEKPCARQPFTPPTASRLLLRAMLLLLSKIYIHPTRRCGRSDIALVPASGGCAAMLDLAHRFSLHHTILRGFVEGVSPCERVGGGGGSVNRRVSEPGRRSVGVQLWRRAVWHSLTQSTAPAGKASASAASCW